MVIDEEVSRKVDTIRDNLYTVMKKNDNGAKISM